MRYASVSRLLVSSALAWLEKHIGEIKYDGKVDPDKLRAQIRFIMLSDDYRRTPT
jgi:hypothetical protein